MKVAVNGAKLADDHGPVFYRILNRSATGSLILVGLVDFVMEAYTETLIPSVMFFLWIFVCEIVLLGNLWVSVTRLIHVLISTEKKSSCANSPKIDTGNILSNANSPKHKSSSLLIHSFPNYDAVKYAIGYNVPVSLSNRYLRTISNIRTFRWIFSFLMLLNLVFDVILIISRFKEIFAKRNDAKNKYSQHTGLFIIDDYLSLATQTSLVVLLIWYAWIPPTGWIRKKELPEKKKIASPIKQRKYTPNPQICEKKKENEEEVQANSKRIDSIITNHQENQNIGEGLVQESKRKSSSSIRKPISLAIGAKSTPNFAMESTQPLDIKTNEKKKYGYIQKVRRIPINTMLQPEMLHRLLEDNTEQPLVYWGTW